MAWLTVNGIELSRVAALSSEPEGKRRLIGQVAEGADGSLSITRQARKRDLSLKTVPLTGADAHAWEQFLTGEGQVWSFDAHFYSSKGIAGVGSAIDVEVQSSVKKYGAQALKVIGGENWESASIPGFGAEWTIVWHRIGAGAFVHEVVRSNGAKWQDGMRNDAYSADGQAVMDGDQVHLENSSSTHYYDDLVFSPFLWLDSWPADIAAANYAFGPAPFLEAAGDLVREASTRRVLCSELSETVLKAAMDGEMQSDLRRLSFELKER